MKNFGTKNIFFDKNTQFLIKNRWFFGNSLKTREFGVSCYNTEQKFSTRRPAQKHGIRVITREMATLFPRHCGYTLHTAENYPPRSESENTGWVSDNQTLFSQINKNKIHNNLQNNISYLQGRRNRWNRWSTCFTGNQRLSKVLTVK